MKKFILMLVLAMMQSTGWTATAQDTLSAIEKRIEALETEFGDCNSQIGTLEEDIGENKEQIGELDTKVDQAGNNVLVSVTVPIAIALVVGLIGFFLGDWRTRGKLNEYAAEKIQKSLEERLPEECNLALREYLKKKFPGDLNYLEAAWRIVAHDTKLKQEKKIRVLTLDVEASQTICDQLRGEGFRQIEAFKYDKKRALPKTDLLLIDRFTKGRNGELSEQDIRQIIDACKREEQPRWVHYFGGRVDGLREKLTRYHAMSNVNFSLGPNLMDQMRFAWPMPEIK